MNEDDDTEREWPGGEVGDEFDELYGDMVKHFDEDIHSEQFAHDAEGEAEIEDYDDEGVEDPTEEFQHHEKEQDHHGDSDGGEGKNDDSDGEQSDSDGDADRGDQEGDSDSDDGDQSEENSDG